MKKLVSIAGVMIVFGLSSCGKRDKNESQNEMLSNAFNLAAESEKNAEVENATADENESADKLIARFDLDDDKLLSSKELQNLLDSVRSGYEEAQKQKKKERRNKKKI